MCRVRDLPYSCTLLLAGTDDCSRRFGRFWWVQVCSQGVCEFTRQCGGREWWLICAPICVHVPAAATYCYCNGVSRTCWLGSSCSCIDAQCWANYSYSCRWGKSTTISTAVCLHASVPAAGVSMQCWPLVPEAMSGFGCGGGTAASVAMCICGASGLHLSLANMVWLVLGCVVQLTSDPKSTQGASELSPTVPHAAVLFNRCATDGRAGLGPQRSRSSCLLVLVMMVSRSRSFLTADMVLHEGPVDCIFLGDFG